MEKRSKAERDREYRERVKARMAADPEYAEQIRARRRRAQRKQLERGGAAADRRRLRNREYMQARMADVTTRDAANLRRADRYATDEAYRAKAKDRANRQRQQEGHKRRKLELYREKIEENRAKDRSEKRRAQKRAASHRRYREDATYIVRRRLSARLHAALKAKGMKKQYRINDLVGCSLAELRAHLEAQFLPGMTWSNIHIDHIRPCASFDLTDVEQQRACFHYTNLRPRWPEENQRKQARWDAPHP